MEQIATRSLMCVTSAVFQGLVSSESHPVKLFHANESKDKSDMVDVAINHHKSATLSTCLTFTWVMALYHFYKVPCGLHWLDIINDSENLGYIYK